MPLTESLLKLLAKKMKASDDTHWGKSKWSVHDLDRKRLDCSIKTSTQSLMGVAEIFAKERPNGEIYVELRYNESMTPNSVEFAIIKIPSQFYDRIERHEDPSIADFQLVD